MRPLSGITTGFRLLLAALTLAGVAALVGLGALGSFTRSRAADGAPSSPPTVPVPRVGVGGPGLPLTVGVPAAVPVPGSPTGTLTGAPSTPPPAAGLSGAVDRLGLGATGLVPGDTVQRGVDLTAPAGAFTSVALTTVATTSSPLDADGTNGLQMTIERCSLPWAEAGPPYTYACPGTVSLVLAPGPWIVTGRPLLHLDVTNGGTTDHLRVTLAFPTGAGNGLAGRTSTVAYAFVGT